MTSFDFKVQFSGLCSVVPNAAMKDATKLMVVLPNADYLEELGVPAPKALDDRPLTRHRGFLRIPLANLGVPQAPPDAVAVCYIAPGTFISFETDPPGIATAGVSADTNGNTSLTNLASMVEMMDPPNDIDPAALGPAPPESVLAQVLVQGGKAQVTSLPDTDWYFGTEPTATASRSLAAPAAAAPPKSRAIAHEVTVTYAAVNQAAVILENNAISQRIDLQPGPDHVATVRILNACDDNQLEWKRVPNPQPDVDFRWFYQLLPPDSQLELQKRLDASGLTIPVPNSAGGSGVDCSPHQFAAAKF